MQKLSISRRDLLKSSTALGTTAALPAWSFATEPIAHAAQAEQPIPLATDSPLVRQVHSGGYPTAEVVQKTYEDRCACGAYDQTTQRYPLDIQILLRELNDCDMVAKLFAKR